MIVFPITLLPSRRGRPVAQPDDTGTIGRGRDQLEAVGAAAPSNRRAAKPHSTTRRDLPAAEASKLMLVSGNEYPKTPPCALAAALPFDDHSELVATSWSWTFTLPIQRVQSGPALVDLTDLVGFAGAAQDVPVVVVLPGSTWAITPMSIPLGQRERTGAKRIVFSHWQPFKKHGRTALHDFRTSMPGGGNPE